jgi:hypothetical protein
MVRDRNLEMVHHLIRLVLGLDFTFHVAVSEHAARNLIQNTML